MLQKWAWRLRGKASLWRNVLNDNRETQLRLEGRIKGCRGEEVRQAVSKARYDMKARQKAVEDRCRPECTQARCLCTLDGPQGAVAQATRVNVATDGRRRRRTAGVFPPGRTHVGKICGLPERNVGGGGGGRRGTSKSTGAYSAEAGAQAGDAVAACVDSTGRTVEV